MDWDSIRFPSHPMTPHTLGHLAQPGHPGPSRFDQHEDQTSSVHQRLSNFPHSRRTDFTAPPSESADSESMFRRSYSDLAQQIAYRYPNPGMPKAREGAIGGTWRHVKEVLGHGGSRVCFIDGLVRIYDQEKFTEALQQPQPPTQSMLAPSAHSHLNYNMSLTQAGRAPKLDEALERKLRTASSPRRKGHYLY